MTGWNREGSQFILEDVRGSTVAITSDHGMASLSVDDSVEHIVIHHVERTVTAGILLTPELAEQLGEALLKFARESRKAAS